jgi:hypothetical protein
MADHPLRAEHAVFDLSGVSINGGRSILFQM